MSTAVTPQDLRRAFGLFATGVTVVTAVSPKGEPVGITANSVTSVSLDPPLLLWCLASRSTSIPAFVPGAAFAVHVLAGHQAEVALHFARLGGSKFEVDAFWRTCPTPPEIAEAVACFACRVDSVFPGGDHQIIVGRVVDVATRELPPLVFQGSRFGSFERQVGSDLIDVWGESYDAWM